MSLVVVQGLSHSVLPGWPDEDAPRPDVSRAAMAMGVTGAGDFGLTRPATFWRRVNPPPKYEK
jgi:hypothetical protein